MKTEKTIISQLKKVQAVWSMILLFSTVCIAQQNMADKIRKIVEAEAENACFSGVVLLAHDEQVIYQGAFGYANRDFLVPNTMETKFNIGSITKTFTALAVLRLVAQGKLNVDDPLGQYLPDCPIPEKNEITIYHLLTHSSGLYDYANSEAIMDGRFLFLRTIDEMIPYVYGSGLLFRPGQDVAYSSGGYVLLGAIIEKLGGMPYRQYLQENIFAPAGMANSGLLCAEDIAPNKAEGYKQIDREKYKNRKLLDFPPNSGGGIFSTAPDLFQYTKTLFAGKLLSREYLNLLVSAKTKNVPPAGRVAFAWWIDPFNNQNRIYHTGGTPGFSSSIDIFPDLGYSLIVLSNSWRGGTGIVGLRNILNAALTGGYYEIADAYTYNLRKGIDLFFDGDSNGAIQQLDEAIQGNKPSQRHAFYYAARARIDKNSEMEKATEYLDQFIKLSVDSKLKPSVARAWFWKGQAFEKMNDVKNAIPCYEKSLECDALDGQAKEALAKLRRK